MAEEPRWETLFREDLSEFRAEVRQTVQTMVTKDAFEAERRYRTEQHNALVDRLNAEAADRITSKRWMWGVIISIGLAFLSAVVVIASAYISSHH